MDQTRPDLANDPRADQRDIPPEFRIVGATGLVRQSGFVFEEFLVELQGVRGRRIYREMRDNDPLIGGMLLAISMLIRKVDWHVNPADDSSAAGDVATFVDECLHDMSDTWSETLAQILSFLPWGWSWHELVYKQRGGPSDDPTQRSKFADGRIGWRKWPIRGQESLLRWQFDPEGGVQAMEQQPPPDYKLRVIPIEKSLLFRTTTEKGNPEGRALLRNLYLPWYTKKHIERIEAIGIERDLAGIPKIGVPAELLGPNPTSEQQAALAEWKRVGQNLRRDEQEVIVYPLVYDKDGRPRYAVDLLGSPGQRQFDTDKVIGRYSQQMATSLLADFMLLGQQAVGSYALSSDKSELFAEAIGAWADSIASVVNTYAIPRLCRLNGIHESLQPELRHARVERIDVGKLAGALAQLANAGMPIFPNPEAERYLYEQLDMPVPAEIADGLRPDGVQLLTPPPATVIAPPPAPAGAPAGSPDGSPAGTVAAGEMEFAAGDPVRIVTPHDPAHATGTVTYASPETPYEVSIDGMDMPPHRWYVGSEMAPAGTPPLEPMP